MTVALQHDVVAQVAVTLHMSNLLGLVFAVAVLGCT